MGEIRHHRHRKLVTFLTFSYQFLFLIFILGGGWLSTLSGATYHNPELKFVLKKKVGDTLDNPHEYQLMWEEILSSREQYKRLVKKQKKIKYFSQEKIVEIAFSIDEKVMLFRKDIFSIKRRGTLILYQADPLLIQEFPFNNPRSLIKKQTELIEEFNLVQGNFKGVTGWQNIIDHPVVLTRLRLSIIDFSKKTPGKNQFTAQQQLNWRNEVNPIGRYRDSWYQVQINLIDGRDELLGVAWTLVDNLNGAPSLDRMYYNSDGLIVSFVIGYEVKEGHDIYKKEKLIPLNMNTIIGNPNYRLTVANDFRFTDKQKTIVFLNEELFDFYGRPLKRFNYQVDGIRIETDLETNLIEQP